jgi:hypothetical protein
MLLMLLVWVFVVGVVFGSDGGHFRLLFLSDQLLVFGREVQQLDVVVFGQVDFSVAFR